jgi:hypothetical protein
MIRRNIRDFSLNRRQDGFSALDRLKELSVWRLAYALLILAQNLPQSRFTFYLYCFGVILVQWVSNARQMLWYAVDSVDQTNNNRRINSFSEAECWRDLRFRRNDVFLLFRLLNIPAFITCDNDMIVEGEYAFCIFLYRMHYPSTLAMLQTPFGREYSQISRIFNRMVIIMDDLHRHKVMGNLPWYRSRFDMYNNAIRKVISTIPVNPVPGSVPRQINNICGFIDGQSRKIGRPRGNNNVQFPFWNGYYHMHCIIFLGISFPDGMLVIDPPFPGYFTDVMSWRECLFRHQFEEIMNTRVQNNERRYVWKHFNMYIKIYKYIYVYVYIYLYIQILHTYIFIHIYINRYKGISFTVIKFSILVN